MTVYYGTAGLSAQVIYSSREEAMEAINKLRLPMAADLDARAEEDRLRYLAQYAQEEAATATLAAAAEPAAGAGAGD